MTEQQRGSFKARLSSNGNPLVLYCGSMENVRFGYYFWGATSDGLGLSQRALGKASYGLFSLALFWSVLILF